MESWSACIVCSNFNTIFGFEEKEDQIVERVFISTVMAPRVCVLYLPDPSVIVYQIEVSFLLL
jgi:hypothetical protein